MAAEGHTDVFAYVVADMDLPTLAGEEILAGLPYKTKGHRPRDLRLCGSGYRYYATRWTGGSPSIGYTSSNRNGALTLGFYDIGLLWLGSHQTEEGIHRLERG